MPIDTSSYYPEVNGPDGQPREGSLNRQRLSIFEPEGFSSEPKEPEQIKNPEPPEFKKTPKKEKPWEKAVTLFSHFLSWVLVPLLMPVYGIIFVFGLSVLDVIRPSLQVTFTLIIAGICTAIPLLIILLLKLLGIVEDYGLNGRKERLIPYIVNAICFGGAAWFMASRSAPVWLDMFFAGGALACIINMLINLKWKISAHAAGIAGVVALLIRLEKDVAVEPRLFLWLLIVIGAAGLLGSARIWLGRHTVWQVLAGYLVGFCSVFFLMSI